MILRHVFDRICAQQIHGKKLLEYARDVEKIAAKNVLINGIFKPYPGGFKGNGSFGFVHIGAAVSSLETLHAIKMTKKH